MIDVVSSRTAMDASPMQSVATLSDAPIRGESGVLRKIHLLVFTSLYPNASRPRHGVFVEERLRHLVASGRIEATVVAPVPWFPFQSTRFGRYAAYARVPPHEKRHGISILHPRYPAIPKLGMRVAPALMYHALLPVFRKLRAARTNIDLIDAHYLYPDGVTATRLGDLLGKPVVISARGNDVTLIPNYRQPRRKILEAAGRAAAVVTVSKALKDKLHALGADPEKITVLRNGVDLDRFAPQGHSAIRAKLRAGGPIWLAVGYLIERKGIGIAIEALARVSDATMLIAGDGPEEPKLRRLVDRLGLRARAHFLGPIPHDALPDYYNAADALVLASSREGMPNVALESLACGTPVVAAPFDGVTEVLYAPEAGEVASERSAEAIASAWRRLRERAPTRAATRAIAERLGWQPVVEAQCALYEQVLSEFASGPGSGAET